MGNKCPRNCLECPECGANTVIQQEEGERYRVECAACDFQYSGLEKRAFAAQVIQKDPMRADFTRLLAIYRGINTAHADMQAATLPTCDTLLPNLVNLHARFKRYCKACRSVLVNPEPHPGIKFSYKTMAIGLIPRFQVQEGHLLITNPLKTPIKVRLESESVSLATTAVHLGPFGGTDNVSLLRQVPESSISRESPTSRQVFMANIRSKTEYGFMGPNWCLIQFSHGPQNSPKLVLASVRYGAAQQETEVNLWIRLPNC